MYDLQVHLAGETVVLYIQVKYSCFTHPFCRTLILDMIKTLLTLGLLSILTMYTNTYM